MAYTSADAVKVRFAQVPGASWGTGKFPDDDSLAQIIAAADALIDDYCRDWYAVPFSPDTPETIADISLALAVAEVRKVIFSDGPVPDQQNAVSRREAIALLEKIGRGGPPTLDWPTAAAGTSPAGPPISADSPDPLFTRDQTF